MNAPFVDPVKAELDKARTMLPPRLEGPASPPGPGDDKELAGLLSSLRAPAQQENAFTTLAALLRDRGAQLGGEKAPGAIDKLMKKRAETEKLNIEKRIQARRLELGDREEKRKESKFEYEVEQRSFDHVIKKAELIKKSIDSGISLRTLDPENKFKLWSVDGTDPNVAMNKSTQDMISMVRKRISPTAAKMMMTTAAGINNPMKRHNRISQMFDEYMAPIIKNDILDKLSPHTLKRAKALLIQENELSEASALRKYKSKARFDVSPEGIRLRREKYLTTKSANISQEIMRLWVKLGTEEFNKSDQESLIALYLNAHPDISSEAKAKFLKRIDDNMKRGIDVKVNQLVKEMLVQKGPDGKSIAEALAITPNLEKNTKFINPKTGEAWPKHIVKKAQDQLNIELSKVLRDPDKVREEKSNVYDANAIESRLASSGSLGRVLEEVNEKNIATVFRWLKKQITSILISSGKAQRLAGGR